CRSAFEQHPQARGFPAPLLRVGGGRDRDRRRGTHRLRVGGAVPGRSVVAVSDPTIHPPAVRRAGFLVAAEGVLGLIGAAVYVVRGLAGADQHIVSGYGNALWLVCICGGVLAGGWALITGRRWGRGIGVF